MSGIVGPSKITVDPDDRATVLRCGIILAARGSVLDRLAQVLGRLGA